MTKFVANLGILFVSTGFFILYAPLLSVVFFSFVDSGHIPSSAMPVTFHWYTRLFENAHLIDALIRSLSVAFCSATLATILGTLGAYALERSKFPGKELVNFLTVLPFVLPEIVLGLALLIWFSIVKMTLGWWSMTLAHTTFGVSYVVMVVRARIAEFDRNLEDAARDLGANKLQVFLRVNLPMNIPGVVSGFLMSFILSFDDFIIAFFTTGVGSDTLPLKLYSMIKLGIDPQVYALSTLVLMLTLFVIVVIFRLAKPVRQ